MSHRACIEFLQWALPRLGLDWAGFRRVHRQVCKRIGRRLQELRLPDPGAYRRFLEANPGEWVVLDGYCRIPISRFLRDRAVFDRLAVEILPDLAKAAIARGDTRIRCWSAGCASGEEPYGLAILWRAELADRFQNLSLEITATDADERLIERARDARYRRSSLRELDAEWIDRALERLDGDLFELRTELCGDVSFLCQDIRRELPPGPFDLVLCRNLVLTYFAAVERARTLERILGALRSGGVLVIGLKERLPVDGWPLQGIDEQLPIYRRT